VGQYQPGVSGNPKGRPRKIKAAKAARKAQDEPKPPGPVERRSTDELALATLRAFLEGGDNPALAYRSARALLSKDALDAIQRVESETTRLAREADYQVRLNKGMAIVLGCHPELTADQARLFASACMKHQSPQNMTDTLKDYLGFWNPPPLNDATFARLWAELGLPGELEPRSPEPEPRPCGFKELAPVEPDEPLVDLNERLFDEPAAADPDAEFLRSREVERERARRGQVVPEPPPIMPPVEPEPVRPACSDVWDLPIFPGAGV
jgi:uncharacterized protein DUF5681